MALTPDQPWTSDAPTGQPSSAPESDRAPREASAVELNRAPWYSLYLVLAGFIVVVLGSHAYLYHQSLSSYEHVLHQTARIRDKQRWLANLRLAVEALDAPEHHLLEAGAGEPERTRFEEHWKELTVLMERRRHYDADLTECIGHLQLLAVERQQLVESFADPPEQATTPEERDRLFRLAAARLAAMDRHRADATGSLTELEQLAITRIGSLLQDHGRRLYVYSRVGKLLSLLAFGILIGLLWYGRRLLRVQADIASTRKSVLFERRERLAAVGELCSSVAHGIRNPIASISTSTQLILETETLGEQSSRRLEDILSECRRLAGRVTHLLQFASGPEDNVRNYPLQHALDRAIDELRSRLESSNITATTKWNHEPLFVRGDPERMVLAITEILANALDILKPGGQIHLSCRRDIESSPSVIFDYVDDGPGVPTELRARVFDLFFSTKPGGTGIGLATAKRAAELHGGELSIVDSPTPGLRLRMRLPLVAAPM